MFSSKMLRNFGHFILNRAHKEKFKRRELTFNLNRYRLTRIP